MVRHTCEIAVDGTEKLPDEKAEHAQAAPLMAGADVVVSLGMTRMYASGRQQALPTGGGYEAGLGM